ncbi:hypothetical protein V8E55_006346, partial [Tylopilus felleus]
MIPCLCKRGINLGSPCCIVDIANQYRSKGADIHFMHQDDYAPNMQSRSLPCSTEFCQKAH